MFSKSKTPYEKKAWRLVILCWLAYTTVYIGKKTLSVCLSDMIAEGVCDEVSGGTIGSAFLACYALGQFISGWVGEKVHPQYMVCIGLFLAGAMDILMGFGSTPIYFIIVWGLCGVFCSMLWSPIIRAISIWTSEKIQASAGAAISITIPVGTIICYGICAVTLNQSICGSIGGWRLSFSVCGAILCVTAIIYYIVFRTLKSHTVIKKIDTGDAVTETTGSQPSHTAVKLLCAGLILAAVCILFNGMIKDGLDLWIPTILSNNFISDSSIVSTICTLLPIINIAGTYWCKHIFTRYKWTELGTCALMFVISSAALAMTLLMINFTSGGGILAGIAATLLLAISSAAMLGANNMLLTFIPLHFGKIGRASAVTGMLNCFSYAAASVSGIVVGMVSKHSSWEVIMLIFVFGALLGAVSAFIGKSHLAKKIKEVDSLVVNTKE